MLTHFLFLTGQVSLPRNKQLIIQVYTILFKITGEWRHYAIKRTAV